MYNVIKTRFNFVNTVTDIKTRQQFKEFINLIKYILFILQQPGVNFSK